LVALLIGAARWWGARARELTCVGIFLKNLDLDAMDL
jgi:hypothetical protein